MSTRSGRLRQSVIEASPPRTRKGVSPPRSPGRTRKISPKRSSSRKSPSRKSPTRKSPGRKSDVKNQASTSPAKVEKEPEIVAQNSPSKRPAIIRESNVEIKLEDLSVKLDFYRNTRSRRSEYSIEDVPSNILKPDLNIDEKVNGFESHIITSNQYDLRHRKPVEEVPPRRSSRLREFIESAPDIRRSTSILLSKSASKSKSKSVGRISDEDNSEDELIREKSKSVTRRLATPLRSSIGKLTPMSYKFEFGGKIGSFLLIIVIPLIVFSILISCSKLCSHKSLLDPVTYMSLPFWFNRKSIILLISQYVIQAIFILIPISVSKSQKFNGKGEIYCLNSLFTSIFTLIILFALVYLKKIDINNISGQYISLASTSYVFGVILSILMYLSSRNLDNDELNPYGNTGNVFHDFLIGRQIHAQLKKLNIKLWISRICNINTLVLCIFIFKNAYKLPTKDIENQSWENYKEFVGKVQLKPTLLLYSMMQMIYVLNFIIKEHKITSTFYWQSEGLGYLQIISSALYPYYFTSIAKYVADVDLALPTNILVFVSILYLMGFCIMLISNNIKHDFRKNPLHRSLAYLDTMPTFHGNKLLVSNLWRVLRHPNYAGDILIHISLAIPGILTQSIIAAAPALLTIVMLLHRAWRDHQRCSRRYGVAWQRYCKRVPFVIIPKII